ncbi:hypothetical protein CRM22_005709 [Opisthorchis felineus]|uniref:Uncharacterized protein n=1 Tax=Opisthorchis felineus TaxID=147828 RepID=A0A4S2LVU0_OPIFE|nr:hypothetical protein CRM22_005709 [Opisthorchis felineus]
MCYFLKEDMLRSVVHYQGSSVYLMVCPGKLLFQVCLPLIYSVPTCFRTSSNIYSGSVEMRKVVLQIVLSGSSDHKLRSTWTSKQLWGTSPKTIWLRNQLPMDFWFLIPQSQG